LEITAENLAKNADAALDAARFGKIAVGTTTLVVDTRWKDEGYYL
jgi:hypothetical protein